MISIPIRSALRVALSLTLLAIGSTAQAQTTEYEVLLDLGSSPGSGCSVTPTGGASVAGIDARLVATVDSAALEVVALQAERCVNGTFSAPIPVPGVALPYPVALNSGINGGDAVELAAPRTLLDADRASLIELTFISDSGAGSDVLATRAGGGPILFGLPVQIPTLSILGLTVMIGALLMLAWLAHRRMGRIGTMMAVMLVATAAWAMNFVVDGELSDWSGIGPLAEDPANDATDGSANADILAGFAALDGDELFFRIDVADLENQAPEAFDDAFAVDEDGSLTEPAPGVLANDTDGDLDPLTATLATGPANALSFNLNADGSFDYTPAADFNGSDSFSYIASDGQANSAAASVTITVNPVNDPPVAVGDIATTSEETAVDIDVLANDSDVDGNLVPGSVSVTSMPAQGATSVDPATGLITYTKSADFAGSDSFDYEVCDDGAPMPVACATATVTVTVEGVNDAPVNSVPGEQTLTSATLVFSAANGNPISVSDIDADPENLRVVLSVTLGTLTAVPTAGVLISDNGTSAVTLEAPQAALNAALDGLTYTPSGGPTDTLTVFTDDLGNTGSGGPLTDSDTVTLLVDAPPTVTVTPANGATVRSGTGVQFLFNEAVDQQAGAVTVACMPSGAGITSNPITNTIGGGFTSGNPTNTGQPGDICTLTIISTLVTDTDLIDPPNELDGDNSGDSVDGDADNFVSTYTVDSAPVFVTVSPMTGATVASTASVQATFDEPVDFSMGGFTLDCGGGALPVTPSGSGTDTLTFTPNAPLPEGSSCTATLLAANVDDSDTFDPPSNPAADVVVTFSVDAEPVVVSTLPGDSATQVATSTTVSFSFSEIVDASGAAITLNCAGNVAGTVSGSGSTMLTFTPSTALPEDTACTATAVAANISDSDAIDPPDNLPGDVSISFTTDAAPTVVNTVPASGATLQPPTDTITINFSESVNFDTTAGAGNTSFDLECPAATPAGFTVITASPASSVVIDPVDLAVTGETCVLTIRAAGITDVDAGDPPDTLAGEVVVIIGYDDPAIANDDSYVVTPHLTLFIDSGVQSGRVLANDTVGSATITGFGPIGNCAAAVPDGSTSIATAAGGSVVLNLNGSFGYAPPAGLVGNGAPASPEDGFCYTLTGGDTADVLFELALTELVWFADAAYAGANGPADGTQARPHTNLPAIAAVDGANDTIHVAANAASYTGIQLESGTQLIGSGAASDLATITGIVPVAGSAFPALGGTRPVIAASGIIVTSNNVIRGLNIGDTSSSSLNAPAPFGSLTMSEASILGNGRAMNLTGPGTLNLVLDELSSSGGFNGVIMSGVGGSITVGAGGTNIGSTTGGDAIFVQLAPAGTNLNFGATTISSALGGVTSNVNDAGAVISFTSLAITTPTGAGLVANSGTINIAGVSNTIVSTGGPALSVAANTGAGWTFSNLSSTNSPTQGIILNNITGGGITATGGSISGSVGTAFEALNGLGGGVSYAGSLSKTSAGRLVDISGAGTGNATLSGDMSCTGACGTGAGNHGLRVNGRTGGTISFSGGTKAFSSSATNPGVSLTNNTGATINFSNGGLAITSTTGNGFEATGGGTVTVQGAANSISNTGGIALNVIDTTIGATGLSFQSVASDGGVNGIVLDNTGASGFFLVNGDGSNARNGSGGTIQNTTGDGVLLINASNVTLASMNLVNVGDSSDSGAGGNTLATNDHAVQSEGGGSIVLSGVFIDNPAAGGWEAVNLGGVNRIDNNSRVEDVNVSNMQALEVRNTSTNMTSFTIDSSEFANQSATNGSSYVLFQGFGTSVMNVVVGNSSLFEQLFGMGLQANGADSATVTLTVQDSTFRSAVDGTSGIGASGGLGGIVAAASDSATLNYGIDNNTLSDIGRPLANAGIVTVQGIGGTGKTLDGTFNGNTIDRIGYPTAAAATGSSAVGHRVIDIVTENNIARLDHQSDGNFVDDTSREAFFVSSRDDSQDFDISITNNSLGQTTPIGSTNREAIEMLSEDNSDMEAEIINNLVAGNTSALDQVVDIDTENTSTMDIHFIGNTVTNAQAAGGLEVVVDTENGTSTHCMVFSGNTANFVEFNVNAAAGGHRIEDFANIGTNNPGVANFIDGVGVTPVTAGTCQLPDF